jgi:SulP family sulfate permease
LFFGSTDGFQKLAKKISSTAETILFRFDRMEYIDQSGLYALEDLLVELSAEDKRIYFVHLPKQPRLMMEQVRLVPRLVPAENIFEELTDFLQHIKSIKK